MEQFVYLSQPLYSVYKNDNFLVLLASDGYFCLCTIDMTDDGFDIFYWYLSSVCVIGVTYAVLIYYTIHLSTGCRSRRSASPAHIRCARLLINVLGVTCQWDSLFGLAKLDFRSIRMASRWKYSYTKFRDAIPMSQYKNIYSQDILYNSRDALQPKNYKAIC